jgi:heterodisulfide reductase subunit B
MEKFPTNNNEHNEEENNENAQEKIDAQLQMEADRLKVNIESLQEEISNAGGVEKVKEKLQQPYMPLAEYGNDFSPRTMGEQAVYKQRESAETNNMAKKIMGAFGVIFAAIAAYGLKETPDVFEQIKDMNFTPGNADLLLLL